MERTRTAPPTASDEGEVASLPEVASPRKAASRPEELPPLASLLEQVRSPGAGRAEVDALLQGLSQPMPPEHSPREHADLLLSLIGDELIASYTGTDGRTVRGAAIQALLALGYPYALEVPPEALEAVSREERTGSGTLSHANSWAGFGLVILAALLQSSAVLYVGDIINDASFTAIALSIVAATTLLPALLAAAGQRVGSRGLLKLGTRWLTVTACLWAGIGVLSFAAPILAVIPVIMAGIIFLGGRFLDVEKDR